MSTVTRIIIDTDPGVDDAMALFLALASPELQVEAVTTVLGNGGIDATTRNAAAILALAGRSDIPVGRGAALPLSGRPCELGTSFHGEDGLGGTGFGKNAPLATTRAVDLLLTTVDRSPAEITLVALGPLTNLALALGVDPELPRKVRAVVLMGGAVRLRGNATPVAEANIYHDPEAAWRVFHAGWPLTMVGLDVTERAVMTPAFLHDLWDNSPVGGFLAAITPWYLDAHRRMNDLDGIYTHDPSAVAFLLTPDLFTTRLLSVDVETDGLVTRGATVPDYRSRGGQPSNVSVALDVDSTGLLALIRERLCAGRLDTPSAGQ